MDLNDKIKTKVQLLDDKYQSIGQDLESYLDGLLYANPLYYWQYTNLDALLNLQHPKTDFPDEEIFIIYHQITELYFKLSLSELDQISKNGKIMSAQGEDLGWNDKLDARFFVERLKRINNYFLALTNSFSIMVNGMEKDQFLKFRMSLLPASGFQSAQYRMIELSCTELINLTNKDLRESLRNESIENQAQHFYWKEGAIDTATGKKTLMLENFEKKYMPSFLQKAHDMQDVNLLSKYLNLSKEDQSNKDLIEQLRELDLNINVNWPLVHYKSAVRYLSSDKEDIDATGGTNWQKYLPPRFQKRIFFPNLWSKEEQENWGRQWVVKALNEL
jgi:tryptophan 2,3-dioxygenase